jgi:hypothetical protein
VSGPTRVYLTVDVECAEERRVRGRVQPPLGYDPRVWGRFVNHRRELGVGLLMDELEARGLRGTFYVDPFGSQFFGEEGLAAVLGALRRRGHDVQLHAHPVQRRADFLTRGERPAPDDLAAYDVDAQAALIEEGLAIFSRCGVPREAVVSLRAGNFGANNDTWEAMRRAGLLVSSNLNACYLSRGCRIVWPRVEQSLFDTGTGVWELPISNFVEGDGAARHLQLAAVSLGEMLSFLRQARRLGIRDVVIVTHSFELFHLGRPETGRAQLSRINLARLQGLARFLERERDRFEVLTVADLARRLPLDEPGDGVTRSPASGPLLRAGRLVEQALKRFASRFGIRSHHSGRGHADRREHRLLREGLERGSDEHQLRHAHAGAAQPRAVAGIDRRAAAEPGER